MNADLERLITLQRIDSAIHGGERRLAEEPEIQRTFDARVEASHQNVAAARDRLVHAQGARREVEKELAVHQGRLSKFRDQLMAVKTNIEYQAMQKEIEFASHEIKALEDRILEFMIESDDLTAAVKSAEAHLASDQKAVDADKRTLASELTDLKASLASLAGERSRMVGEIDPRVLTLFTLVARRRNGVALAEARGGVCTICHVRLRPQVFNDVLRNDQIIQCDHCNRILYHLAASIPLTEAASQPAE